jgi:YjbE family integral membrane protein
MRDYARLQGAESGDASVIVTLSELSALAQVVVVDLVLAGDNAIVVGLVAAGLPRQQRAKVIFIGIAAATVLRIGFAVVTTQLLQIIGLTLAGGLLLLWVTWKLWRELKTQKDHAKAKAAAGVTPGDLDDPIGRPKSMRQAVTQIVLADISMSLDNVLAVAGISLDHTWVLVFGLVLSVALMGAAAALIAGLLKRFPWVSYIGLAIIFYVAVKMIYSGSIDVMQATGAT